MTYYKIQQNKVLRSSLSVHSNLKPPEYSGGVRRWKLILNPLQLLSHFINSLLWLPGLILCPHFRAGAFKGPQAVCQRPPELKPAFDLSLQKASVIDLLSWALPKWDPLPRRLTRGMLTLWIFRWYTRRKQEMSLLLSTLFSNDSLRTVSRSTFEACSFDGPLQLIPFFCCHFQVTSYFTEDFLFNAAISRLMGLTNTLNVSVFPSFTWRKRCHLTPQESHFSPVFVSRVQQSGWCSTVWSLRKLWLHSSRWRLPWPLTWRLKSGQVGNTGHCRIMNWHWQ